MTFRLLVTGTRYGVPESILTAELKRVRDDHPNESIILVHGDAPGVDQAAARIGASLDMMPEPHGAKWRIYGRSAGPRRNQEMVDLGADLCLAFFHPTQECRGTVDCSTRAEAAGIPVRKVRK